MTQVTIKRAPTGDRGPPGREETITVDILTTEQLSPRMSKLPNGSLLCKDVPIARVGWMVYGPGETPIKVGGTGVAYVERTADELFSPETIGSFMASAVVDEHPNDPDGVIPANWKQYAKGFSTTNVRRGTGDDADVLLADLIITDKALIESVLAGKREVSCGYDADYEQTGPGLGRQTRILGNHIALVRKGRCGPRCAIGDHAPTLEGNAMPKQRVPLKTARRAVIDDEAITSARQRVTDAQAELEALEEEHAEGGEDEGAVHVHIHQGGEPEPKSAKTEDRIAAVEDMVGELSTKMDTILERLAGVKTADEIAADEAAAEALRKAAATKTGDGDDDGDDGTTGKTKDSAALADSYAKVLAQAEVLVPGFRMPTFDAALTRKATVDVMCQARRKCLDMAYSTKDGQELIDSVSGTKELDLTKLDCKEAAILFNAAAGAKALLNNRAAAQDSSKMHTGEPAAKAGPPNNVELNKAYAEFWAKQEASTAGA